MTIELIITPSEKFVEIITALMAGRTPAVTETASTNGQAQPEKKAAGRPKKVDEPAPGITLEALREYGNKVSSTPEMTAKVKKVINDHGSANLKTADPKNYQSIWDQFAELEKSVSAEL